MCGSDGDRDGPRQVEDLTHGDDPAKEMLPPAQLGPVDGEGGEVDGRLQRVPQQEPHRRLDEPAARAALRLGERLLPADVLHPVNITALINRDAGDARLVGGRGDERLDLRLLRLVALPQFLGRRLGALLRRPLGGAAAAAREHRLHAPSGRLLDGCLELVEADALGEALEGRIDDAAEQVGEQGDERPVVVQQLREVDVGAHRHQMANS